MSTTQIQQSRPSNGATPINNRSSVTTGRRLFVHADGRGPWARRFRDLVEMHTNDLGGADMISSSEASLIKRSATLVVELEILEGKFSQSDDGADEKALDLYQRMCNTLRRTLEALGLQRRPRTVRGLPELLGGPYDR